MAERDVQAGLFGDDAPPPLPAGPVVDVAVAAPIRTPLTYLVPEGMALEPGVRVRVPLGGRTVDGFVLAVRAAREGDVRLKPVAAAPDPRPLLTPVTRDLGLWMAEYYGAHPGECLQTVVPAPVRHGAGRATVRRAALAVPHETAAAALAAWGEKPSTAARRRLLAALLATDDRPAAELLREADAGDSVLKTLVKQGLVVLREAETHDDDLDAVRPPRVAPPAPSAEQAEACSALHAALDAGGGAFVLHGVTGSGKTEVYLRLAEETLARGRGVIMLVPEIALTPQTVERFRARLGDVAVLHSNQSEGARARRWEELRTGRVRVALGPRSALFAPLLNVGAVLVDEEHESTFKQQNAPRYHARDVALRRAAAERAVLVLGSATPSLEAERLIELGVARRLRMSSRIGVAKLPEVRLVDMRHEKPAGPGGLFSQTLMFQMREALRAGGQVLLFLNRLGFSTQVLCKRCGWRGRCDACDVNLTYHRGATRLLCHYCGRESAPPVKCPDCGSPEVKYRGAGTEKVAEAALALFPEKRVARMDGETLEARGAAERIYAALKAREIDILVGTQVVAKGLDLPGITLIGVVNADTSLLLPDFRAAERTFQLLCQVAGRAGRGDRPGKVLIQTFEPEHYAVRCALHHDHDRFVAEEMRYRRAAGYPPFGKLARVVYEGVDDALVERVSLACAERLKAEPSIAAGRTVLLGPAPCPIPRIQSRFRRHLVLRAPREEDLSALMEPAAAGGTAEVRVMLDRDPTALL
jgi:primosomal protein N' (replication factor Y)